MYDTGVISVIRLGIARRPVFASSSRPMGFVFPRTNPRPRSVFMGFVLFSSSRRTSRPATIGTGGPREMRVQIRRRGRGADGFRSTSPPIRSTQLPNARTTARVARTRLVAHSRCPRSLRLGGSPHSGLETARLPAPRVDRPVAQRRLTWCDPTAQRRVLRSVCSLTS